MVECRHPVSMGRKGQRGTWCLDCGTQVLAVDERECKDCEHYRPGWGLSDRVGTCRKHLMGVSADMHVTFDLREGTCWTPKQGTSACTNQEKP